MLAEQSIEKAAHAARAAQAAGQPPIERGLDRIGDALGRLDEAIKYADDRSARLEHRLSAVIGPPVPRPGDIGHLPAPGVDEDTPAESPMASLLAAKAEAILALADRVQKVGTDLDYLADRVEL